MPGPAFGAIGVDFVFLARHGHTEWNRSGRRQGQLDSPLTVLGRAQAHAHAAMLRDQAVDAVVASPLGRARSTAQVIGDQLGLGVRIVDDFAEIHHGEFAGLTDAEIEALFPGALSQRAADKFRWRFPGGESYADADRRVARALTGLVTRRPLIVAHEMIGRMIQRRLLGLDPATALATDQPNAVIYAIDPTARTRRELRRSGSTAAP